MKIIIDTDKKQLGAEDVVTMGQLYEFLEKHGLMDYGLMAVKPDSPSVFPVKFIPADDPLAPPYKITCTGDPIPVNPGGTCAAVSHIDQDFEFEAIKFGYQQIDPNKYRDEYLTHPRRVKHWHQPQNSITKEFIES
jgi:hypothetical protein